MIPLSDTLWSWLERLGISCLIALATIGTVYFLCRIIPRLPADLRVWLWWMVCLRLLLGLFPLPAAAVSVLPATLSSAPAATPTHLPAAPSTSAPETTPSFGETPPVLSSEKTESPGFFTAHRGEIAITLFGIWLIGIGFGLGAQAMALLQLRRQAADSETVALPELSEAAQRAGLRQEPRLLISRAALEPMTAGLGSRALILLAREDLNRLSDKERLMLLTHECLHIRRGDLWLSLVPWLAQTVFWFFPPAYFALREFQLAREAVCDASTVSALEVPPVSYGELLVKLSSPAAPLVSPSSVMALSANFHLLKRRIEMLNLRAPSRSVRAYLAVAALTGAAILLPWKPVLVAHAERLPGTAAADGNFVPLPNLDFSQGLAYWHKTAMGSDTMPHPFYELGLEPAVSHDGHSSAYVRSKRKSLYESKGDGGVLRYDIPEGVLKPYLGKRIRLSAFVQGKHLTHRAFLFLTSVVDSDLLFAESSPVTPQMPEQWQRVECVFDIPKDADNLEFGLRLEGEGTAYGSGFQLETVDKSVALSSLKTTSIMTPPENLDFQNGLKGWWNDDPTNTAAQEYSMILSGSGHAGGRAALLQNRVAHPNTYGTIAQNASAGDFSGKTIRFSAYMKTEDAEKGELWIVVHDRDPNHTVALNAGTTGKVLRGTNDWTKMEYIVDIPSTTSYLSFGISSEGKGKVWVDGFQMEAVK